MKVKDVLTSALTLLGRADAVSALSGDNPGGEEQELITTLLYCFNAVENELARKYIPLSAKEEMSSPNAHFYYRLFNHYPIKIKRVTADGSAIDFEVFTQYMVARIGKITVEYDYAPTRKKLDDASDYGDGVGEYLIALGVASEYSLINGEAEMAEQWEKKYRAQLDRIQRTLPACGSIPPRRWI